MIYRNMPYEEYAKLDGMNYSTIKHMRETPLDYRANLVKRDTDTASRALLRYQHAAALEPETLYESFAVWTGGRRGTNAYKAFLAENEGKGIVKQDESEQALRLAAAVRAHPLVSQVLAMPDTETELSVGGFDAELGHAIKCRLDLISAPWWLDMKDYGSTDPRHCGRMAYRLSAVHQAAFNRRCLIAAKLPVPEMFGLICVNGKNLDVAVLTIDLNDMTAADLEIVQWFKTLHECERTGIWPGNGDGMLDLPSYAFAPDIDDFLFREE